MINVKRAIRKLFRQFGWDLVRYHATDRGLNPYLDMTHYIINSSPVVFDVGANLGESLESFISVFPSAHIYCFEPSVESFRILTKKYLNYKSIKLYCEALGGFKNKRWFKDNEFSDMSSFLELGTFGYGKIIGRRLLDIRTVDNVFAVERLDHIDILKIDSQGFELDILRGCSDLLHDSKINLVLVELTFTDMYQGLPNVEELLKLLYENNFVLSGFYRQHFQNGYLSWADGLFVNKRILDR